MSDLHLQSIRLLSKRKPIFTHTETLTIQGDRKLNSCHFDTKQHFQACQYNFSPLFGGVNQYKYIKCPITCLGWSTRLSTISMQTIHCQRNQNSVSQSDVSISARPCTLHVPSSCEFHGSLLLQLIVKTMQVFWYREL